MSGPGAQSRSRRLPAPGCRPPVRQLSREKMFTGTTVLDPAQHTEPWHQSRHQCFGQTYQGKDPVRQPGLLPRAAQEDAEQPEEDQSFFQRVCADMEQAERNLDAEQMQQQQLKLRDRQKFFEEVFQHDVDFFFPMSHLQIEHRRPPLGSISSMEVNVDMLEQMDVLDLSDQDTVDVFLGCGTEESSIVGSLPGADASQCPDEITLQVPNAAESKSRISSTSSASTDLNSLDTSEEGAETPVVQSDEEDLQEDSPKEQVVRS